MYLTKGPVGDTVFQMMGGLRSGMGYVGCHSIAELRTNAKFIKITGAGLVESHPHDVYITKEAPTTPAAARIDFRKMMFQMPRSSRFSAFVRF